MPLFQSMTTAECQLKSDRVDIWEFSLSHLPNWAMSCLEEEERERAQRFHFPRHQRRFAVSRAMLRAILGLYFKKNPAELLFTYGSHGKPKVNNTIHLQFNLTHSEDLALLAIGQQFPLGIDIEFFSTRPYLGLANTVFSSQEIAQLSALPPWLIPLGFFHTWSQKEALIKACGLGLSYPTKEFDVPVISPMKTHVLDTKHQKNWQIISFMPRIACSAALCCEINVRHIRYISVDPLNFHPF